MDKIHSHMFSILTEGQLKTASETIIWTQALILHTLIIVLRIIAHC